MHKGALLKSPIYPKRSCNDLIARWAINLVAEFDFYRLFCGMQFGFLIPAGFSLAGIVLFDKGGIPL